jgi:hypothetical protein
MHVYLWEDKQEHGTRSSSRKGTKCIARRQGGADKCFSLLNLVPCTYRLLLKNQFKYRNCLQYSKCPRLLHASRPSLTLAGSCSQLPLCPLSLLGLQTKCHQAHVSSPRHTVRPLAPYHSELEPRVSVTTRDCELLKARVPPYLVSQVPSTKETSAEASNTLVTFSLNFLDAQRY